jgi:hypothetical protein
MRKAVAQLILILGGALAFLVLTPAVAHADCGEVTYRAPPPAQEDPCGGAAVLGIVTAAGVAAALLTIVAVASYASGAISASSLNTLMNALTDTTTAQPPAAAPRQFDFEEQESRVSSYGADGSKTTYGGAVDSTGQQYDTRSDYQREDRNLINAVNQRLRDRNLPLRRSGNAHHAEQKFAGLMATNDIDQADLFINNPAGLCGYDLGCEQVLSLILKPEQKLTVHWRDPNGVPQQKSFEGNR